MRRILWILFAALLLQSCNKYDANGNLIKEYEELNKAQWLLGDWEKTDSLGTLTESWKALDDSTYTAKSVYVSVKKDTIHREDIELMQTGDFLIYTSTVKGENNDQPTQFQLREEKDSVLVFENPKHNYPKKIQYKLNKDASALLTISGTQNGKPSVATYLMARKN